VRRRFLNDPTPFLNLCDDLPFEKDLALDLYNFEFPLPKDDLYQVLLKYGLLVLEKKIFTNFQYIFTVSLLSPLGEGGCPSFVQF
jgi:hypothetical protein